MSLFWRTSDFFEWYMEIKIFLESQTCFLHSLLETSTQVVLAELKETANDRANIGGTLMGAPILGQKLAQYTRCVRKVSDLRSYLRVSAILRHPDRGILPAHFQRCFHILKQSSNADFGMAFSSRVALLWILSMSSNRFPLSAIFSFGNIQKSQGAINLVFRQKLLHKVRWMRWRVIAVKKPVTAWLETRSFSSHSITHSFQNFNVIFYCWSSDLLEQILSAQHPHNRKKKISTQVGYFSDTPRILTYHQDADCRPMIRLILSRQL